MSAVERRYGVGLGLAAIVLIGCTDEALTPAEPDLRVDSNRNGQIDLDDPTEDDGEELWDRVHGAVFLANIDDDLSTCPQGLDDLELYKCNDAADSVINGSLDLADFAEVVLKPCAISHDSAEGSLLLSEPAARFVRLFKKTATGYLAFDAASARFSANEMRSGVELILEGRDIVRDLNTWDGYLDMDLVVNSGRREIGRDRVRMRVSPVMTYHHLLPAEMVHVSRLPRQGSLDFRTGLREAVAATGLPYPIHEIDTHDPWTQDFFEPGFMSMPVRGGGQHVIRTYYRSANTRDKQPSLRRAGQIVFNAFRGGDMAGIQEFDENRAPTHNDTYDSLGNTETIPPYTRAGQNYPLGRLFRGSIASLEPDITFTRLLEAQRVQPPVYVDTTWLAIGHVDETISFVKANTARGWVVLANDPALAVRMLESEAALGQGAALMFENQYLNGNSAAISIDAVLADTDIMAATAEAAVEVDAQLRVLEQETGVTSSEIVPMPFLHTRTFEGSIAYQPGTVNGLYFSDAHFAAPDPHGPVIGGEDIFKVQLERALGALGIQTHFLEDWDLYHTKNGEVHCATNATRRIPDVLWWETGR